jgi:hypothetical protein
LVCFVVNLVFFPVLVCCAKKNLATLVGNNLIVSCMQSRDIFRDKKCALFAIPRQKVEKKRLIDIFKTLMRTDYSQLIKKTLVATELAKFSLNKEVEEALPRYKTIW